jgi:hypothetical protein
MAMASLGTTGIASAHTPSKSTHSASNNLVLDSYEPNNDGFAGAVTSKVLPLHSNWVAEVQGTISYYASSAYTVPSAPWPVLCGTPDLTGPMFPSLAFPASKVVGMDPEFLFARPWTAKRCAKHPLPLHWSNFQISRGAGFAHRTQIGGRKPTMEPDHKYLYPISGIGEPAQFRLKDRPRTSDNYGTLHILVRRATAADCETTGWSDYGFHDLATCQAQITWY